MSWLKSHNLEEIYTAFLKQPVTITEWRFASQTDPEYDVQVDGWTLGIYKNLGTVEKELIRYASLGQE